MDVSEPVAQVGCRLSGGEIARPTGASRPIPVSRVAPKRSDGESSSFLFRFKEAAVRELTDPAISRHSTSPVERQQFLKKPAGHRRARPERKGRKVRLPVGRANCWRQSGYRASHPSDALARSRGYGCAAGQIARCGLRHSWSPTTFGALTQLMADLKCADAPPAAGMRHQAVLGYRMRPKQCQQLMHGQRRRSCAVCCALRGCHLPCNLRPLAAFRFHSAVIHLSEHLQRGIHSRPI
jgi:hypothetical protein